MPVLQAVIEPFKPDNVAGPGGSTFYHNAWLAREETRQSTSASFSPIPNLMYLPDLQNGFKARMHAKHRLDYADHRHIHLIDIICSKDTRPGAQLEASQQQHNELLYFAQLQGAEIILHTNLPGCGWDYFRRQYPELV
eukprot:1161577-Pelagomonas_calceolata.AAC.5